jgi:hypothetical protein
MQLYVGRLTCPGDYVVTCPARRPHRARHPGTWAGVGVLWRAAGEIWLHADGWLCVDMEKPGRPLERASQASLALLGNSHEEHYTLLYDT